MRQAIPANPMKFDYFSRWFRFANNFTLVQLYRNILRWVASRYINILFDKYETCLIRVYIELFFDFTDETFFIVLAIIYLTTGHYEVGGKVIFFTH